MKHTPTRETESRTPSRRDVLKFIGTGTLAGAVALVALGTNRRISNLNRAAEDLAIDNLALANRIKTAEEQTKFDSLREQIRKDTEIIRPDIPEEVAKIIPDVLSSYDKGMSEARDQESRFYVMSDAIIALTSTLGVQSRIDIGGTISTHNPDNPRQTSPYAIAICDGFVPNYYEDVAYLESPTLTIVTDGTSSRSYIVTSEGLLYQSQGGKGHEAGYESAKPAGSVEFPTIEYMADEIRSAIVFMSGTCE
jgi:hypothetical protein